MSETLRLEWRSPSELAENPRNWRRHPESQLAALDGVLSEVGWAGACLFNETTGRLIDGHARRKIAQQNGSERIPVLVGNWTEEDEAKILATLDPIAAVAEIDSVALDDLLREVQTSSQAVADLLKDLADEAGLYQEETPEIVEDDVPEVPDDPITKPGDLWLLGDHRLLCGDSTKAEDVARLMGGEKAMLMNTDPPYGVGYANDERPNPGVAKPRVAKPRVANEALQEFLQIAFRTAVDFALCKNAAWYMWHAHLTQGYFAAAAAAAAADVILHRQIIWVKPVLLLGRGQYHWKHEPCFMGWIKGNRPPDYGEGNGERTQTTVWNIGTVTRAERKEFNHSTPKPVELFAIPLVKHTRPGEVCYEPFSGSGPQIIAAEQLNRRCFAMELSPQYCDVAVTRWEKLTGKKATRDAG